MTRARRQRIARRRTVKRIRRAIEAWCRRTGALQAERLWRRSLLLPKETT